jgi:hypothetical protein
MENFFSQSVPVHIQQKTNPYVHSVPVSAKIFTPEDLELSLKYIDPDFCYPGLYKKSSDKFYFVDRRIVDIKSIETDPPEFAFAEQDTKQKANFFSQTVFVRATGRGANADYVDASIVSSGYELSHVPISVSKCPNGKLIIVDGRTRLNQLIQLGFTNVIVDYYVCTEWKEFLKTAIYRNRPDSPRSPMTKSDIINNCNGAIKMGWLKRETEEIRRYVEEITDNRIQKDVLNKIILSVQKGQGHSSDVVSFDEKSAEKFLVDNGYIDNQNNNGIYYKVYASTAWTKAFVYAAKTLQKYKTEGKNVKELRVIIHTGTLDAADPAQSWKSKIDNFRTGWKSDFNDVENSHFKDPERRSVIRLYGAIPAVTGIGYAMDKLVMFHVSPLKDNYFHELDKPKQFFGLFGVTDDSETLEEVA